jgi:hypothetical protein
MNNKFLYFSCILENNLLLQIWYPPTAHIFLFNGLKYNEIKIISRTSYLSYNHIYSSLSYNRIYSLLKLIHEMIMI